MSRDHLDLDVLRSFVTGIELGSYALAAQKLNKSTSAVSAQLKKLEDQTGQALLQKVGRGLTLTPCGEVMFGYARRLLELNDEALMAVRGSGSEEARLRFGMQEDFGESLLPGILGQFSRAHPQIALDVKVARNQQLLNALTKGELDLVLAWDSGAPWPYAENLGSVALCWIDSREKPTPWTSLNPIPLVSFEAPCQMRAIACASLENQGLAWRQAFSSSSLSGIWAAVTAGLGLTVRTPIGLPDSLRIRDDLPPLPTISLTMLHADPTPSPAAQRLAMVIRDEISRYLTS